MRTRSSLSDPRRCCIESERLNPPDDLRGRTRESENSQPRVHECGVRARAPMASDRWPGVPTEAEQRREFLLTAFCSGTAEHTGVPQGDTAVSANRMSLGHKACAQRC